MSENIPAPVIYLMLIALIFALLSSRRGEHVRAAAHDANHPDNNGFGGIAIVLVVVASLYLVATGVLK